MAEGALAIRYAGRRGPLFGLALRTGALTVLTLGFYRFWMKTRMRRYYWSAIRPGGIGLEFTGRPAEMLTGFLTAVVVLAFYIGLVNLALMFLSFSLFQADAPAYAVSFLGLVPMIFFAQYRARRFILARTRWRGIRFGQEPGVKGFVWRAALWWLATLCTGGILWPAKTFALERYRANRMWFGDARFEQTGGTFSLMGAMKHVYFGAALLMAGVVLSATPAGFPLLLAGGLWGAFGLAYWRAESFRRLTEGKRLGEITFTARPSGWRLGRIYLGGALAIGAIMVAVLTALAFGFGAVLAMFGDGSALEGGLGAISAAGLPGWLLTVLGLAAYFSVFLLWSVLREVFLTLPVVRHLAESVEIHGAEKLVHVRQRPRDEFAEAEGFADALPLGDGI